MAALGDEDRETLTAYLDGELDDEAEQALEARLHREPDLRAELEAMRQTWGMLDFLPRAAPSADFTNRTIDRLSLEGRTTKTAPLHVGATRRLLVWGGTAVATLALGFAVGGAVRHFLSRPVDPDEALVRELRLLERMRAYEAVEDIDFLRGLDHPDLFGEEGT